MRAVLAADFALTRAALPVLEAGYGLGLLIGTPLMVLFTRRMPQKTVLMASTAACLTGNALCALAPNFAALLAARWFASPAAGSLLCIGAAIAMERVSTRDRALMLCGLLLAFMAGNILAGIRLADPGAVRLALGLHRDGSRRSRAAGGGCACRTEAPTPPRGNAE